VTVLPPPISTARNFPADCINLARAVLGGYACSRCHAGLREHGSELCLRRLEQSDRITECAEAFWRELRAR
jgi:hypothetical protein